MKSKLLILSGIAIVFTIGIIFLAQNHTQASPRAANTMYCGTWADAGDTISSDKSHDVIIKDRWGTEICAKNKGIMANWVDVGASATVTILFTSYYSGSGSICQEDYDECIVEVFTGWPPVLSKSTSYDYKWGYCIDDSKYVVVMLKQDDCNGDYVEVEFSDGIPYDDPEMVDVSDLQGETGDIKIGSYTYGVTATTPSGGWCYEQTYGVDCPGTIPQ